MLLVPTWFRAVCELLHARDGPWRDTYIRRQRPPRRLGTGEVRAVVVVPEGRGPLLQRVYVVPGADRGVPELAPGVGVKRVVAVPARGVVGAGALREKQVGRVAVALRRSHTAAQMDRDRNRYLVALTYQDFTPAPRFDGRTGEDAFVTPSLGL